MKDDETKLDPEDLYRHLTWRETPSNGKVYVLKSNEHGYPTLCPTWNDMQYPYGSDEIDGQELPDEFEHHPEVLWWVRECEDCEERLFTSYDEAAAWLCSRLESFEINDEELDDE